MSDLVEAYRSRPVVVSDELPTRVMEVTIEEARLIELARPRGRFFDGEEEGGEQAG